MRYILFFVRWLKKIWHHGLTSRTTVQLFLLSVAFVAGFKILQLLLGVNENDLFHQMTAYDAGKGLKIVYLFGVIFFSGFLVMVLTNGVRNVIEKIENGDVRYGFSNHIIIFGYNDSVIGIIKNIKSRNYHRNPQIVIVTKDNVRKTKELLDGIFGQKENIYVMHGNMDNIKVLKDFYPDRALEIFVVGNYEDNVDFLIMQCYHFLTNIPGFDNWRNYIYLYLHEPSSITMIKNRSYGNEDSSFFLGVNARLKIINTDEIWARRVIVDSRNRWPERNVNMRGNIRITMNSRYYTHILVYGLNTTSEFLTTTVAKTCHHPNYVTSGIRTKITVVDDRFTDKMGILFGKYNDLMEMCHYKVRKFHMGQELSLLENVPKVDFLDIEWDFIESDQNEQLLHKELEKYCGCERAILSIFVCVQDSSKGINIALNLPKTIFDKSVPIWVYSQFGYNINEYMTRTRYDNILTWGMVDEVSPKEEWEEYSAKYLNYFYDTISYHLSEHEDSSINQNYIINNNLYEQALNAWNMLNIDKKQRMVDSMSGVPSIVGSIESWSRESETSTMSEEELEVMAQTEHIRWCVCSLLEGYRPLTEEQQHKMDEYQDTDKSVYRNTLRKEFYHPDIKPYNQLSHFARDFDKKTILFYCWIINALIKTS